MEAPPPGAPGPGPRSARAFVERITALAHAKAGRPAPERDAPPAVPLVPIYIGVDRPEPQEALREMFLYRLGDARWSVKPATSRFILETGLTGAHEKLVEDQINSGLRPYKAWADPGTAQLVALTLRARLGDQVFRDELLWDVGNPQNTSDAYAMRVCADVGLGADWYGAIRGSLQARLDEVQQDLREAPEEVELVRPSKRVRREPQAPGEPRRGVPRLEPHDPADDDAEAARQAARVVALAARAAARGDAAPAAAQPKAEPGEQAAQQSGAKPEPGQQQQQQREQAQAPPGQEVKPEPGQQPAAPPKPASALPGA
ncbi:hypothetical protein HT031_003815 [Scenedesmus sp. PABB004]|nr:hypothetical protein HT031_003815 [Scenedesmus sp. PABB004]